ncbi:MAG: ABC transporter ATP-binding protein/permease [Merismopedia sp. SIO2A8]|nr:ABC transporter ATP-binding protein/permease [Merismopedia sp. SIO2A8]
MERFNFRGFQRFWAIAQVYWFGDEKWAARKLLVLITLFLLASTGLSVLFNNQRGALISALAAADQDRFWSTVGIYLGVLVVYAPLLAGYTYLRDRLGLAWRRWLTDWFVDRYFGDRAFYRINQGNQGSQGNQTNSDIQTNGGIDNPDQRIAEDVRSFTQESLTLILIVADSVLTLIAFSSVLWGISQELVAFLLVYAILGTVMTVGVFGQPLVKLNFEQLKREANFRFSLVRVRENAEAIAFYQGEGQESSRVKAQFMEAFDNYKRLIFWQLNLNGFSNAYEFIPFILPAVVVAPAVFSGEVEVGKVSEAQGAFLQIFFSLNIVVAQFQSLTAFGAGVDRLYDFSNSLAPIDTPVTSVVSSPADSAEATTIPTPAISTRPTISCEVASTLVLDQLTLQTPNYQRVLVSDLSLDLPQHSSLLVMGPSGCGKSSLLRAIAGLWNAGSGLIQRPELKHLLFLPQKPYMVLGTLRQQLLYPYPDTDISDGQLKNVLNQVNLPNLVERFGGLEAENEWGDVLSLGEQQRLSFARVLLHQPTYAILDEATSALDQANEEQLYALLKKTGTTYLSVGHRQSLENYHQQLLRLSDDGTWQFQIQCP